MNDQSILPMYVEKEDIEEGSLMKNEGSQLKIEVLEEGSLPKKKAL